MLDPIIKFTRDCLVMIHLQDFCLLSKPLQLGAAQTISLVLRKALKRLPETCQKNGGSWRARRANGVYLKDVSSLSRRTREPTAITDAVLSARVRRIAAAAAMPAAIVI